MWRVWTLQGGEAGLVQSSFAVILVLNIGAGSYLGKQEGSFANSSARLTGAVCGEGTKEREIIPIALKPVRFKAIGKRAKCQRLFLLGLAPWDK